MIGNILKIENLSLKKANSNADYNQIDKRSVEAYQKIWNFGDKIAFWLKLFTGELDPERHSRKTGIKKFKDRRRLFLNETPEIIQKRIIDFFKKNRIKD
jgi:hypothetical protein